jgi:hypothetical protein
MKRLLARLLATGLLFTSLAGVGLTGSAMAVDVFQPCDGTAAKNSAVCKDADSQKGSGKNPVVNAIKVDRKSTRLNSSHNSESRMPSSA